MNDISKYKQEGYQKFRKALFAISNPIFNKRIKENEHEWVLATKNILLNEKGPRQISRPLTKEEEIISKIQGGFLEIALSYDLMTEIPLYIKKYPQSLTWKSKFLEFVVVNYFNEVYILSERLEAYTKKIMRLYKNHPETKKVKGEITAFNKVLNDYFNNNNNIKRGWHVHKRRYRDDDLSRLSYLEVLYQNTNSSKDRFITSEYKKALAFNKKKWLDLFERDNKKYEGLLGMYFTAIYYIVFDKNGNFRNPK